MSKIVDISSFKPDDKNFNKHTEYGMGLLEKSIEKVGIIEAVTVSADGKVISGNARQEVMSRKFEGKKPIVVETDGTTPIVIKRNDIQSDTKEFHEAAILANSVAKANISFDFKAVEEIAVEVYDIDLEDVGIRIPKEREIIGNNYEAERDVNNEDYVIVHLSKTHLNKLYNIINEQGLETTEDAILHLIENI